MTSSIQRGKEEKRGAEQVLWEKVLPDNHFVSVRCILPHKRGDNTLWGLIQNTCPDDTGGCSLFSRTFGSYGAPLPNIHLHMSHGREDLINCHFHNHRDGRWDVSGSFQHSIRQGGERILTFPLGLSKVININSLCFRSSQDLFPINGSNMTQVIVIEEPHWSSQNVCGIIMMTWIVGDAQWVSQESYYGTVQKSDKGKCRV